jgi:hypothetical protein
MEIYKITNNIDGKIYIGKDTTSNPNYFGSGLLIKRAIQKYGINNFIKEVIDSTNDYSELSVKEKYWIKHYNSNNINVGYNLSSGGDGGDTLTNHPDILLIKQKISENNPKTGKTYEEAFGEERARQYKNKLKQNLHKNLFSEKSKENLLIYYQNKKKVYYDKCVKLKELVSNEGVHGHMEELKKIKNSVYSSFFGDVKNFYNFFENDLKNIMSKGRVKKVKLFDLVKKNNSIIVDSVVYESIRVASEKTGIKSSLIKYRLRSPLHPNYVYTDENKNVDKNGVPYEKKRKKIIIEGEVYSSIEIASQKLNIPNYGIYHRLNASSYPNWKYLNGGEKKINCEKRNKSISINGIKYNSITEASIMTKIHRETIRYRLRNCSYSNYEYL